MDIRPCPFCGKKAIANRWFPIIPNSTPDTWRVSCVFGCGNSSNELTEENAIFAWNRRTEQTEGLRMYGELLFFTSILLAVSVNRAQSLALMEDFIADLKNAEGVVSGPR